MFKHAENVYGHIDIVFPNAGVGETGKWLETTLDAAGDPRKPNMLTTNVNLLSVSYSVYLAFHYLRKNPAKSGKSIVFIGSRCSSFFANHISKRCADFVRCRLYYSDSCWSHGMSATLCSEFEADRRLAVHDRETRGDGFIQIDLRRRSGGWNHVRRFLSCRRCEN